METKIALFQNYLKTIRVAICWSQESLGACLGLSRQSVYNIESGRTKLSMYQYIAIRAIFDAVIASNPEQAKMASAALLVLVDEPDKDHSELLDSQLCEIPSKPLGIERGSCPDWLFDIIALSLYEKGGIENEAEN